MDEVKIRVIKNTNCTLNRLFKNLSAASNLNSGLRSSSDQHILSIAMGLQMGSEHPLAKAVIAYCTAQSLKPESLDELKIQAGIGIQGKYQGQNLAFMSHHALLKTFEKLDQNEARILLISEASISFQVSAD